MYNATRHDGLGQEVKRRILMGTYALSAGYYDAYYKRAQQASRAWELLKNEIEAIVPVRGGRPRLSLLT